MPQQRRKQLGDEPGYTVQRILHEYKIHNCEILLREDVTVVSKRTFIQ